MLEEVRARGVNFVHGEAEALVYTANGQDVTGVRTNRSGTLTADLVVLASGAWTSTLLPELSHDLLPTGQVVATIQLTSAEADKYCHVPVSPSDWRRLGVTYTLVRRSLSSSTQACAFIVLVLRPQLICDAHIAIASHRRMTTLSNSPFTTAAGWILQLRQSYLLHPEPH